MRRTAMTMTAAMLMALSGGAAAQDKSVSFESLDKDSDGKISLNEASEHDALFVAFKGLDANKDGQLTREEFAAYRK